jgi:hypothetical protein
MVDPRSQHFFDLNVGVRDKPDLISASDNRQFRQIA